MPYISTDGGPKESLLSALHVIVTIVFLFLINLGFAWVVNHILLGLFDWFNGLSFFWKVTLLFLGGFIVVELVTVLANLIAGLLGVIIYSYLPINRFTRWASGLLVLGGFIWTIYDVWTFPTHFSFWIVIELLLISGFAYGLYYVVYITSQKEAE
jgi:hypothetical protein